LYTRVDFTLRLLILTHLTIQNHKELSHIVSLFRGSSSCRTFTVQMCALLGLGLSPGSDTDTSCRQHIEWTLRLFL